MQTIIEIYKSILSGRTNRFPNYTWESEEESIQIFKVCFRYLVTERLKFDREELISKLNANFIFKYKLSTPFSNFLSSNPYKAVTIAFPEWRVEPWELKTVPSGTWDNINNIKNASIQYYKKNNLSRTDLINGEREAGLSRFVAAYRRLNQNKTNGDIDNDPDYYFEYLKVVFPYHNFRIWEFKRVSIDLWSDQDIKEGFLDFFNDELKWSKSEVIEKIHRDLFDKTGLAYLFKVKFKRNCAALLEFIYNEPMKDMRNLRVLRAPKRKLLPNDIRVIREMYKINNSEKTRKSLAVKYKVHESTIRNIWNRSTWKNIE